MKNWKKYMSLLLALVMCLSLTACGEKAGNEEVINDGEVSNDGEITLDDLVGYWSPVEGLGSTTSALICIYLDAANGIWEEYDQYGDRTGYTGAASTDGTILTLSDVPLIGDVDIPIGDADTLVTDTGETYWVKGYPGFMDKPGLSSSYYGNWYLRGDHDSEYATVLTLNEDGTYSWYGTEGTYTYSEFDEHVGDTGTTVFRQQIELSASPFDMYYLVSDGQVLVRWSDASNGDDYYIHEDALDNASLLTEYNLTNESFSGQNYSLEFYREYTVDCNFFNGETRTGTWAMDDTTILIFWDDGEMDEAKLDWKTLYMSSTGETLENPW